MTREERLRFTLSDNTEVIVKELGTNTYDFELILPNGSRKTFRWSAGSSIDFVDRKGNVDVLIYEALEKFQQAG